MFPSDYLSTQITSVDYSKIYASSMTQKIEWSPEIEKVIFNPPATIVFWKSGEKTVVKCNDPDKYDKAKGVALCYMKKALGNKSGPFNNMLRKAGVYYTEEENEQKDDKMSAIDRAADKLRKQAFIKEYERLKRMNFKEREIAVRMGFKRMSEFRAKKAEAMKESDI